MEPFFFEWVLPNISKHIQHAKYLQTYPAFPAYGIQPPFRHFSMGESLYGRRETTVRQTKATLRLQAVSTEAPTKAETNHGAKDFFAPPNL